MWVICIECGANVFMTAKGVSVGTIVGPYISMKITLYGYGHQLLRVNVGQFRIKD